jgi:glycolate oxidase iron-sulfur subunit
MNDLSATDRCVKCGLCLPHCPTFALTGNEADSPRGRISLMQALGESDLQWSPGLFHHLDQCLHCGACEAMCPSGVPFGQLMDNARAVIEPRRKRPLPNRVLRNAGLRLLTFPAGLHVLGVLLGIYQKSGLQSLLNRIPVLPETARRLNHLLPVLQPASTTPVVNTVNRERGEVSLFCGCTGSAFDQQTLSSTRHVLQRLGYRVNSPAPHACCGALHQHNGAPQTAHQLADANLKAFSGNNNPIVVTASGCTAHLLGYKTLYADQPATAFAERVSDIMHFLSESGCGDMRFGTPEQKVAVYMPCTHRNNLKQQQDVMHVLKWIPGPEPVLINPDGGCCGAAGSYMLSQPELSERLCNTVVECILESGAGILLTTNIGCSIQLQAALKQRAAAIEVLHPVVLLERLLQDHFPNAKGTCNR